jgi:Lrp/AsnC family transcriptional regulator
VNGEGNGKFRSGAGPELQKSAAKRPCWGIVLPVLREMCIFRDKITAFAGMGGNVLTETEALDAVDARILELLQQDASLSIAEIADRVGLSSSPCWRRIERLKKAGVITKQVTLLDREKLGLNFEVFASVKLTVPSRENLETFERAVAHWPEVVDCATVTGAVDYMLRIITIDMHAYDDFLRDKMLALGLVSDVQSRILMRIAKRTTATPLSLVARSSEEVTRAP